MTGGSKKLTNNPHDEAFDVDDDERVPTPPNKASPTMPASGSAQFGQSGGSQKKLSNQAHDEAMDVDDDDHVPSPSQSPVAGASASRTAVGGAGGGGEGKKLRNTTHDEAMDVGSDEDDVTSDEDEDDAPSPPKAVQAAPAAFDSPAKLAQLQGAPTVGNDEEESSSEEDEDDDGTGEAKAKKPQGATYDPSDFAHLQVSKEIKQLFGLITQYTPHDVELDTKIKPFIPDYIPAVGDIDTFVKIPRPDNKPEQLGLTVLDEPCANPSNAAVIKLGLAYQLTGAAGIKPSEYVESIEEAGKRPSLIDKWVSDIGNLHKKKAPQTVNYANNMPDVEPLLQVWPSDFEDLITPETLELPPAKLDVELYQYVRILCAMLDIPVYKNIIESLHVLFTLYSEFKANQHFQGGSEL